MATKNKLTKGEKALLTLAYRGPFRPALSETIAAARRLAGLGYLLEHDSSPGSFAITLSGEIKCEEILALKKVA